MTGWVAKAIPAVEFPGEVEKTSWVAAPGLIEKAFPTAEVRPEEDAVKVFDPTRLRLNPEKDTAPELAVRVFVPERVPEPLERETVMELLELPVTVLPY